MARQAQFAELARQLSAFGAVKRELERILPPDCPAGSTAVLGLLGRYGEMRMTHLAELLSVDMSVSSRHVAHLVDRGWIERAADPADKRSRILRLTPAGRAKLAELSRRSEELLAERLDGWSAKDVDQLTRLLTRMRAEFDCRPGRQGAVRPVRDGERYADEPGTGVGNRQDGDVRLVRPGTPDSDGPRLGGPATGSTGPGEPRTGSADPGDPATGVPRPGISVTGNPGPREPRTGSADPGDPATGAPGPGGSATGAPNPGEPHTGTAATGVPRPSDPHPREPRPQPPPPVHQRSTRTPATT